MKTFISMSDLGVQTSASDENEAKFRSAVKKTANQTLLFMGFVLSSMFVYWAVKKK